jgi:hypothetical protein
MQVSYDMLQSMLKSTRAMRTSGMVKHYKRFSLWITNMAKTSLYMLRMKIRQTMTFFVHNSCIGSKRSKQS